MFKTLRNELILNYVLEPAGPLLIKSGKDNGLQPERPNMTVMTTYFQGKECPVIPGSSMKGVIRSRLEQLLRSFVKEVGGESREMACYITDNDTPDNCNKKVEDAKNITDVEGKYAVACRACQLFGNTFLASRIKFSDAIGKEGIRLAQRTCVAIDRVTGGVAGRARFDVEVVETGKFYGDIHLRNFALWQVVGLLAVLNDIQQGIVTLGSATSRGFGRVKITALQGQFRDYRLDKPSDVLWGYRGQKDQLKFWQEFEQAGFYQQAPVDLQMLDRWPELMRQRDFLALLQADVR
ncbi:CRISPR-associated RAMP protein Csx7 [Carboxydocella sp. JDF658]|uniref:type III CRISPR-associated RAMP protein Csx7 n=1 Tax=Carboxydocella sp. JDF658 TaxID=1926600 RepID=UPI0009ACBCE6|nr:CRISPR-associated RAMP protein Csx7 [Carboxydocella sp. JDF658]GAW32181.1 CRISPR-associated RAMP protein [Carboxydocella sp. JDF658]